MVIFQWWIGSHKANDLAQHRRSFYFRLKRFCLCNQLHCIWSQHGVHFWLFRRSMLWASAPDRTQRAPRFFWSVPSHAESHVFTGIPTQVRNTRITNLAQTSLKLSWSAPFPTVRRSCKVIECGWRPEVLRTHFMRRFLIQTAHHCHKSSRGSHRRPNICFVLLLLIRLVLGLGTIRSLSLHFMVGIVLSWCHVRCRLARTNHNRTEHQQRRRTASW